MSENYYDRAHLEAFGSIAKGNKALADQFFAYYGAVFADGSLSVREKSLAALAVAHVVQCPYCIDAYTGGSLEAGADLEQMTEAVHVAAAVRGGTVIDFGAQMLGLASKTGMGIPQLTDVTDAYFSRAHPKARAEIAVGARELWTKLDEYERSVFEEGALSRGEKHVIAVAVAHTIQNPYAIELHTKACLEEGYGLEQLTEAVHVANAIRGGASLVHGIQMLEQVEKLGM